MLALPPNCSLHRAGPADLAAYADLSRRTFADTYRSSHPADALARHVDATFTDERLRAELEDPRAAVLAITHGATWIAYALLTGGAAPPEVVASRPVEIAHFYVDAQWHGRGVAAALMDAALDVGWRHGHDAAWLAVWEQNPRALRFYSRCGFVTVGRATYMFDGYPERDHVMVAALPTASPLAKRPPPPVLEIP